MPECPLSEAIEKLRKDGRVPIGVVTFDVNQERMSLILFPDVNFAEAHALLATIGMEIHVDSEESL
jgi:hypothetical protein